MTTRVRLLGRPCVEREQSTPSAASAPPAAAGQPHPQPRGQKSWAVLARVVLAERTLRRSELAGGLFPEADDPAGALRWALADLRRSLGDPALLRGDPLTLVGSEIRSDVRDLEEGTLPDAEFGLPLLEGIELRGSPDFNLWLMMERSRWAVRRLEELRRRTLRQLAVGDAGAATRLAEYAVNIDPLDESAQELLLRALVADGRCELAEARLAAVAGTFARDGLAVSAALRAAAQDRARRPMVGMRAGVVARSLLQAGTAALDAGAADGGIETLRRAAEDAAGIDDAGLQAEVQLALGSALVHAVRGFDGEGAVVLHRALVAAEAAQLPTLAADVLRELAYIDVQAGRHASAEASLAQAGQMLDGIDEPGLSAGLLAMEGMNAADRGRHIAAAELLRRSVAVAIEAGRPRQQVWSLGVLARSLLLGGQTEAARRRHSRRCLGRCCSVGPRISRGRRRSMQNASRWPAGGTMPGPRPRRASPSAARSAIPAGKAWPLGR